MNFDTLAPIYRPLEWLLAGSELQTCRLAFLNSLTSCRNILLLGEGPGRFLEIAANRFPRAHFTVLDSSPAMLHQAKRTWNQLPDPKAPTTFLCSDALAHPFPTQTYDALVTPFFLDCFTPAQLESLLPTLSASLQPGGVWLLADFAVPDHGFARRRAQVIHALMYVFFRHLIGIPAHHWTNPAPQLTRNNLMRIHHRTFDHGLLTSSVWQNNPHVAEGNRRENERNFNG